MSNNTDSDLIYKYTRADAIRDGVLIDLDDVPLARGQTGKTMREEAGIRFNIAVTSALFAELEPTAADVETCCQSMDGRLWDLFMLFGFSARKAANAKTDTIRFEMGIQRAGDDVSTRTIWVKAVIGPGDDWEPVITMMLPDED